MKIFNAANQKSPFPMLALQGLGVIKRNAALQLKEQQKTAQPDAQAGPPGVGTYDGLMLHCSGRGKPIAGRMAQSAINRLQAGWLNRFFANLLCPTGEFAGCEMKLAWATSRKT